MRNTVYIAAPYAAETPELIDWNIRRATLLAKIAARSGLAPLLPHAIGAAGVHGCPHESDDGKTREVAIECGVALAASCDQIWLLLRADGTMSSGCEAEVNAWSGTSGVGVAGTWHDFAVRAQRVDLLSDWLALCIPPGATEDPEGMLFDLRLWPVGPKDDGGPE